MSNLKVLDCTLRDGGYVNNWEFGSANIKTIIKKLSQANIDIIECGFLTQNNLYNKDHSQYINFSDLEELLISKGASSYVCMVNYGEVDINIIPKFNGKSINGIRVAYHKNDLNGAIEYSKKIIDKGYELYLQPMVTLSYTDKEFLDLIDITNKLQPKAFYIVDSFGAMKQNDLVRLFYLTDNNLNKNICIGYHSHNNLQLAYSNAQSLLAIDTDRTIIADTTVLGMGRGAGNLNTELFIENLNSHYHSNYLINPILEIADEVLHRIYQENYWGYSLPHYLSATNNCHPNYASFLSEKNILTIKSISDILSVISPENKIHYDKNYIEKLYLNYQKHYIDDQNIIKKLTNVLVNRKVLILAPGKSLKKNNADVEEFINLYKPICISVNFISDFRNDYIFISNNKRFEMFQENDQILDYNTEIIITSNNISNNSSFEKKNNQISVVDYSSILNDNENVADNVTLMLLKLLIKCDVKEVYFAGFDGYSYEISDNYVSDDLALASSMKTINNMNTNISLVLQQMSQIVELNFLTPTRYKVNN